MRTRALGYILALTIVTALSAQVSWRQRTGNVGGFVATTAFAHDTRRDSYLSFRIDYRAWKYEMWQLRGTQWSKLSPKTFPVPSHMVYDPRRDRSVMYSYDAIKRTGSTWEWDGKDWTLRKGVNTPVTPRAYPLVYDPFRAVVTQLYDNGNTMAVRIYDGVSWKERKTTNAPSSRSGATYAISTSGALLLHGGVDARGGLVETWLLTGSRWIKFSGQHVGTRVNAGMCFDPTRNRFVLLGGRRSNSLVSLGDTWEWAGTWRQRLVNSSVARERPFMLWDPIRERSVAHGGAINWSAGGKFKRMILTSTYDYGPDRPARFKSYGRGCGSARTAPKLVELSRPWIGSSVGFRVDGVGASTPLVLFTGASMKQWGSLRLPLDLSALRMPGCFLNASVDLVTPTPKLVRYGIPNVRALVGLRYFHQVGAIDAAANAAGLVLSSGAELVLGEG